MTIKNLKNRAKIKAFLESGGNHKANFITLFMKLVFGQMKFTVMNGTLDKVGNHNNKFSLPEKLIH